VTQPLDELSFETQLVHAGERAGWPTGEPTTTPIYTATTYTYDSMVEVDRVFAGEERGYVYTRYGNPTVAALEEAVRLFEKGAGACAYSSGMAALHAALLACELEPGSVILASQDLYGVTLQLLNTVFAPFGVKVALVDLSERERLWAAARDLRPRAILVETISNPLLKICPIDVCAEVAREVGARLIVDNTFATPYLCQPLELGADFVVHSATKYLSGHADAIGGVVVARDEADLLALRGVVKTVGGVLSVWEAYGILRGLKTLALRMRQHCENARRVAERLASHPLIRRVHYPLLVETERETAARVLRALSGGGLVAIELKDGSREAAFRFMEALRLCVRATSLGDVFTGVLHPATSSHREMSPAQRAKLGISDSLIRISVGIEDVTDIIADLEQALEKSMR
jgi:cystathionine gamma-synthase/methionine-gamma-lyase